MPFLLKKQFYRQGTNMQIKGKYMILHADKRKNYITFVKAFRLFFYDLIHGRISAKYLTRKLFSFTLGKCVSVIFNAYGAESYFC